MQNNEDQQDKRAALTKRYVIIALALMLILSLYVGWTMSENYRSVDSQMRSKLTQLYKKHQKEEYKFDIPRGHTLYHQLCVKCHSANGQGVQGSYPPLAGSQIVINSFQKTTRIVLHGMQGTITRGGETFNKEMPGFKNIDSVDMAHLINYIRHSFGNRVKPVPAIEVIKTHVDTVSRKTPYTESELDQIKE